MFVQLLYFFSAFASHYTLASEVPPSVIIKNGVNPSFNSSLGNGTFTGDVWLGTAYTDDNATIAHVFFTPSARTFWHRHEKGQLLNIVAGTGRLGDKGSEPRAISAGDIVWCPPGVIHWHGANPGSHMIHLASGYGATEWFEEVTDQEYTSGAL